MFAIDKYSIENVCYREISYRKRLLSRNFFWKMFVIEKFSIENVCYRKIFNRKCLLSTNIL